ncbi:MAG: class I SAM-dependent methyltransferase [Bacteroidetes bacterium]|nr:class I SAM-dependent methyltransferase [Bacteroidota bacterium]
MSFTDSSYEAHSKSYSKIDKDTAQQWTDESSVDYWRHKRMYDTLLPILNTYKNNSWLTIGDGKYGTDAHFVLKHTPNVLASDIAEDCLKLAKENGFIPDYKIENAEKLSFDDNTFDFALVKEAYHHFPRPMIALYEMLRVSKIGIVLIEPNDPNCQTPQRFKFNESFFWLINSIKNSIKKIFGRKPYINYGGYEEAGNFIYSISEREVEKVALGLNYALVAFKGINDDYFVGVEKEKLEDEGPLYQKVIASIKKEDKKVKRGQRVFGINTIYIFKEMPNENCLREMENAGFKITKLPRNPYL